MRLHSFSWLLALPLAGYVLVNGLGCSDDDHGDDGHTHGAAGTSAAGDISDFLYEGGVTDEAVQSILGVQARTDDAKAPAISAPTEGAAVPGAPPFTFAWSAGSARLRLPAWLGPERSAHAHGTPYTGVAYVLVFRSASNDKLLRVATSKTSYTPSDTAWKVLQGAGSVTLTVTTARLEQNLLAAGTSPVVGSKGVSFTVSP